MGFKPINNYLWIKKVVDESKVGEKTVLVPPHEVGDTIYLPGMRNAVVRVMETSGCKTGDIQKGDLIAINSSGIEIIKFGTEEYKVIPLSYVYGRIW